MRTLTGGGPNLSFRSSYKTLQTQACTEGRRARPEWCTHVRSRSSRHRRALRMGLPAPYPFGPLRLTAEPTGATGSHWPAALSPSTSQTLGTVLRWMELESGVDVTADPTLVSDLHGFEMSAQGKSPWSWDRVSLAEALASLPPDFLDLPSAQGDPAQATAQRKAAVKWLVLQLVTQDLVHGRCPPLRPIAATEPWRLLVERVRRYPERVKGMWGAVPKHLSQPRRAMPTSDTAPDRADLPDTAVMGDPRFTARQGGRRLLTAYFVRVLLHRLALRPKEFAQALLPGTVELLTRWAATGPEIPLAPIAALVAVELRPLLTMDDPKDKNHWIARASSWSKEEEGSRWVALFNPACVSLNTDPQEVIDWFAHHLPNSPCPARELLLLARCIADGLLEPARYALLFGSTERTAAHPAQRLIPHLAALNTRIRADRRKPQPGVDDWTLLHPRRQAVRAAFARLTGLLAHDPRQQCRPTLFRQAMAEVGLEPLPPLDQDVAHSRQDTR